MLGAWRTQAGTLSSRDVTWHAEYNRRCEVLRGLKRTIRIEHRKELLPVSVSVEETGTLRCVALLMLHLQVTDLIWWFYIYRRSSLSRQTTLPILTNCLQALLLIYKLLRSVTDGIIHRRKLPYHTAWYESVE